MTDNIRDIIRSEKLPDDAIRQAVVTTHADIAPRWPMTHVSASLTRQLGYFTILGPKMEYGILYCMPEHFDDLWNALTERRVKKGIQSRTYNVLMKAPDDEEWEPIATIHSPAMVSIVYNAIKETYHESFEIIIEEAK